MADLKNPRRNVVIGLALAAITLAVYWPVRGFQFTNFDDGLYVSENAHLTSGSLRERLVWAFTSGYAVNWHPLTWISHMLDVGLYGLNPAGHHMTNLFFHVANTVLLFGLLVRLTRKRWRSAFVAALFAWHPMHVESVAWVAERKDVLSTFFALLTLLAYARYARELKVQGSRFKVFYALALMCFALGLMAKPMLVTLPVIMLLLDLWPLGRIYGFRSMNDDGKLQSGVSDRSLAGEGEVFSMRRISPVSWQRALCEKAPFLLLAAGSSLVTFLVQKSGGAMVVLTHLPLAERAANAVVAYVRYIGKLIWPHDMAVLYPYNHSLPAWQVWGAGLLLAAVSGFALGAVRKRPYVAVGWFWFVIGLVPVIGLVQVGDQSMADRYTYFPATGLFLLVAWEASERLGGRNWSRTVLGGVATLMLVACLFVTARQLRYWQDSITLFSHDLKVTPDNATPHNNLGGALNVQGRYGEAITQFTLALKLRPDWDMARNNLGIALLGEGKLPEAFSNFQAAIKLKPDYENAIVNLGLALARQGKWDAAIEEYQRALKIAPDAEAENRLGGALESQGKIEDAVRHYTEAVSLRPDFAEARVNLASIFNAQGKFEPAREQLLAALKVKPELAVAHYNLGNALAGLGNPIAATAEYLEALRLQPEDAQAHFNLANLMAREKKWDVAALHYSAALRLQPDLVQAHINLAIILDMQGKVDEAINHYRAALHTDSHAVAALKNLAWLLATTPDSKLRDGGEAFRLSTLATQLAPADPAVWDTHAAACAEAGRFDEAARAAKKAIDLATSSQNHEWLDQVQSRLKLYEAGRAFHESTSQPK